MCVSWSIVNEDKKTAAAHQYFILNNSKTARKPVLLTALQVCDGVCMCTVYIYGCVSVLC